MLRGRRLPMFVVAGGLLGLIVVLATLQYRWLGQISEAERDRMSATLRTNAASFAEDFDRELNRAYLLFQVTPDSDAAAQVATRYDRWQATARFPRLIRTVYLATPENRGVALQRFDPATRALERAEWPSPLDPVRAQLARAAAPPESGGPGDTIIHAVPTVWAGVPALVVSAPIVFVNRSVDGAARLRLPPPPSSSILLLDADYLRGEMLPSLAQHYFRGASGGVDYDVAVVSTAGAGALYRSAPDFSPAADARVDATADLFYLRVQDFGPLASEISRFTLLTALSPAARGGTTIAEQTQTVIRHTVTAPASGAPTARKGAAMSFFVRETGRSGVSETLADKLYTADTSTRLAVASAPHWRLLVKHPSGSLEQAVDHARRRNLFVSTGVLGLLAVSVGFLVASARRAHDLARQQLEFVATVSHELRTPLAVIRSAADNLADGVVGDEARVRQYGELVRREGRRLTELVEQTLEYAGLQSGQREVSRQPLTVGALLRDAIAAASPAAGAAGVRIDLSIADDLPPVAGDEAALRRVFLNLIGNAVKYGAGGAWVGIRAASVKGGVEIAISDRGIGIAPGEQDRIFEPFYRTPDVVAAQIQGAGLGLSLVARIVEAHRGRIVVASAPGEGSTFTVTLPAAGGDSATNEGIAPATPQHP